MQVDELLATVDLSEPAERAMLADWLADRGLDVEAALFTAGWAAARHRVLFLLPRNRHWRPWELVEPLALTGLLCGLPPGFEGEPAVPDYRTRLAHAIVRGLCREGLVEWRVNPRGGQDEFRRTAKGVQVRRRPHSPVFCCPEEGVQDAS
jgi:hypothetical protein